MLSAGGVRLYARSHRVSEPKRGGMGRSVTPGWPEASECQPEKDETGSAVPEHGPIQPRRPREEVVTYAAHEARGVVCNQERVFHHMSSSLDLGTGTVNAGWMPTSESSD
jgi:hypothetical protein